MKRVNIGTSIEENLYDQIKSKGYKINFLIRRGFLAIEGEPQLLNRVRESEAELERNQKNIEKMAKHIMELNAEIENLKELKKNEKEQ